MTTLCDDLRIAADNARHRHGKWQIEFVDKVMSYLELPCYISYLRKLANAGHYDTRFTINLKENEIDYEVTILIGKDRKMSSFYFDRCLDLNNVFFQSLREKIVSHFRSNQLEVRDYNRITGQISFIVSWSRD